jgi:alpha/beta superfamily hydrolase
MLNNVVLAICRALVSRSIAAFRFNFRGAGNSGGTFGEGTAEQEDVKAALDFVSSAPEINGRKIGLAGYSFGGGVALPIALQDERVNLLALVSPALSGSGREQLQQYTRPKLLIIGDADSVILSEELRRHIRDTADSGQYQIIPGADHFWVGYEDEVAQKVSRFFTAGFNQGQSS